MTNVTQDGEGGRRIGLFLPFKVGDREVKEIYLQPFEFGWTLDWKDSKFKSLTALLVFVSGQPEEVIRKIRYPDADRVMSPFVDFFPSDVRADIERGRIPAPPIPPMPNPDEPYPNAEPNAAI